VPLASGTVPAYSTRVAWAVTHLAQASFAVAADILISHRATGHGGFVAARRSAQDRAEGLGQELRCGPAGRGAGLRCSQVMVRAARMASAARAIRARAAKLAGLVRASRPVRAPAP
jgi:hypothetical protein